MATLGWGVSLIHYGSVNYDRDSEFNEKDYDDRLQKSSNFLGAQIRRMEIFFESE